MKVLLLITERQNTMRDLMGGPAAVYDACLLSQHADINGTRARLMLPGELACDVNKAKLRQKCVNHLVEFGFTLDDIEIKTRVSK